MRKAWFASDAAKSRITGAARKINAKTFMWVLLVKNLGGHFATVANLLPSTEELATKAISYARSTITFAYLFTCM